MRKGEERERSLWSNVLLTLGGSGAKILRNSSGFCSPSQPSLTVIKMMCSGEMRIKNTFTPERHRVGLKTLD